METLTAPGYTQGGCRRSAGCGTHTTASQHAERARRRKGLRMQRKALRSIRGAGHRSPCNAGIGAMMLTCWAMESNK